MRSNPNLQLPTFPRAGLRRNYKFHPLAAVQTDPRVFRVEGSPPSSAPRGKLGSLSSLQACSYHIYAQQLFSPPAPHLPAPTRRGEIESLEGEARVSRGMCANASPQGLPDAGRRGRDLRKIQSGVRARGAAGWAGAEPDTWRNAAQDQRKYDI